MAKTESTFRNMALALTLIALGASACLGFVYELTKGPIALSVLNKKLDAIRSVVPEFTNNPYEEMFRLPTGEGDSLEIYPAKKDDEIIAYAVNTYTNKGFSGFIGMMVGFKPDGKIINITVLQQKETPGLGTKMSDPGFKDQFIDKDISRSGLAVITDKKEKENDKDKILAITAATISSRAFCDAVGRAYNTLQKGGLK